jgi:hypothetical protein
VFTKLPDIELTNCETNSVLMVKSGKSFEQITGGEQTYGEGMTKDVIFDMMRAKVLHLSN